MQFYPQYKDYNEVIVTLEALDENKSTKSYIISNANVLGLPDKWCKCHLESINIDGPVVSSNNPTAVGTTGSVTIIDYKNSVFSFLSNHLSNFLDTDNKVKPESKNADLLPSISIQINCFTKLYTIQGHILDWTMQFSGTTPSINLSWSTICPSDLPAADKQIHQNSKYDSPTKLLQKLQEAYDSNIDFVFIHDGKEYKNKEATDLFSFANGEGSITYNTEKMISSGNLLIDGYNYICSVCVYPADSGYTSTTKSIMTYGLYGEKIEQNMSPGRFIARVKDTSVSSKDNSEDTCSGLMFTNNGAFPAYSTHKFNTFGNRIIIPVTSFGFDTSFQKLTLQTGIRQSLNGTTGTNNQGTKIYNTNANTVASENSAAGADANNDPVDIKFECYNVMSFDSNNVNEPIAFKIYDEFGNENPLSGTAMVRKVSYELSGGVIKANVECTKVFNRVINQNDSDNSKDNNGNSDVNYSPANDEGTDEDKSKSEYLKAYLCSEDFNPISLDADNTSDLLESGDFYNDVDDFLNNYGELSGSKKLLKYNFIKQLIDHGNFGLLTLLLAVADYGIADPNPTWDFDPVTLLPDYKNRKDFCADAIGKAPYDHKSGGLGIAHWDVPNLFEIYTTIGFPESLSDEQKDHLSRLIIKDNYKQEKVIVPINWKTIQYDGYTRLIPDIDKHVSLTKYTDQLNKDSTWLQWAYDLLHFKSSSSPIYIYYLFKLWIDKFWSRTVKTLKSLSLPNTGHQVCIQDAVRISRAGNSATNKIDLSCGKDVNGQYIAYYNDQERYIRQKAFCRRCADIIGWEV